MGSSAFVSGCSVYIGIGCLIVVAKSRSFSVEVDKSLSVAVDDVMTHQIVEFLCAKCSGDWLSESAILCIFAL